MKDTPEQGDGKEVRREGGKEGNGKEEKEQRIIERDSRDNIVAVSGSVASRVGGQCGSGDGKAPSGSLVASPPAPRTGPWSWTSG